MVGIGTIVNVIAVFCGGVIGQFIKGGLKKSYERILMDALALATLFVGLAGSLSGLLAIKDGKIVTQNTMVMIVSLVLGSLIGQMIDIDSYFYKFGEFLKSKFSKSNDDSNFVESFVSISLIICVGAMAIVGSLQDAILRDPSTLFAKSILDFAITMIYSSTLGKGAIFGCISVGIYQGFITLVGFFAGNFLTELMIEYLSFVGSILIFTIGVNMLFHTKVKVANMLPSIVIAVLYTFFL